MQQLKQIDLIVLGVYIGITVLVGVWFYRKSKTPESFTSASGKLPFWVIGLSVFGTYVSSISFLAYPGAAFSGNWNGLVFALSLPFAALIAVKYFIPYYRARHSISAYALLENKFGLWARLYATGCFLLTQIARVAVILYLLGMVMHELLGVSIVVIIIVTGIIVIFYTMLGGIEGVIYTDAIQSVILIIGALLCIVLLIMKTQGHFNEILAVGIQHSKFSLGSLNGSLTQTTFWIMLLFGFTNNLQNLGIDQNYVQRYMTAKSENSAKKSVWLSVILYIPITTIFFFIGTALFVYYQQNLNLLPANLQSAVAAGHGDNIFPFFIIHNLPFGLSGLVIAGIFSAAMSTISSSFNASATLINEDIFNRFSKTGAKKTMHVLYLSTVVMGIVCIGAALLMINIKSAMSLNWTLAGIFGGGILGIFILSLSTRYISKTNVIISVCVGFLTISYLTLSHVVKTLYILPKSPLNTNLTLVIGTVIIILMGFFLSILAGGKAK